MLDKVIGTDRVRGGRGAAGGSGPKPLRDKEQVADRPTDPAAVTQAGTPAAGQSGNGTVRSADRQSDLSYGRGAGRRRPGDGRAGAEEPLLRSRRAEAERLRNSPTTTVTLRVPRAFNEWLDEYVHRSWPERVLKQDLVAEALRLLFARRGRAGEPVLPTNLLADGDES
ncbi:MAG: hypothetical protein K2P78_09395 [Gemmataceae bacterium]|nr:hypothetical protein [Gemmataceae bacterium]